MSTKSCGTADQFSSQMRKMKFSLRLLKCYGSLEVEPQYRWLKIKLEVEKFLSNYSLILGGSFLLLIVICLIKITWASSLPPKIVCLQRILKNPLFQFQCWIINNLYCWIPGTVVLAVKKKTLKNQSLKVLLL